ncbi:MAG TPA: zinc-dependent metalloprotease [Chitinophagaceae bacterium]|nr:zinc-dependent metalloprotease [Chitinophagaceae bacterium]MBP7108049.1 zinc-dependent metalloprotease [Chitinophagaceae bacterium]MBP7313839.1 zinc-dependent metalloprotease [Chitinophagaceae bacterium]HQV54069.1 zinc-dependent metalloprotease [Chitinophagaceae bacterium]HQX96653.1 zinc-dependent metalloprotease [Chitinophagaceae bacterium]
MKKLLLLFILAPIFVAAQKLPSIEEKTKDLKKHDGFINFYWDENTGKIFLEVDKLDTEFLYVTSLPAGLGSNDIGLDRGLLGGERIVKFSKTGRKILLIQPNYNFRATTNDAAERRAVEQSFAQSTIWGFTVEAETGNRSLVDATDFLLRDAMRVSNRLRSNQQGSYSIDKSRSVMYLPRTKNFPQNSEFETTITFLNNDGTTGNYVNSVTPSSEAITLRMHHSFVQLPDNDYEPRVFDPRSSFIPISYYDYSTPIVEPIEKMYIMRHRLKKKNPAAAISEPIKPIIYYVDNGTPEPIRSALIEGGSWWNQAFEAAGYTNAFQVKLLPEDADPMDVRYNVINWVHRSTRGWSYGASVADPRTGEIIKGHVSLGSLRVRQDYLIAAGLLAPYETGVPADDKMLKMAVERLRQLSAHEIGHTIGLMHNYAASVSNRASVMDYPHPLARVNAAGKIDLSNAYDQKIGDWDKVSIAFGYSDFPTGTNESASLNKILTDAAAKGLQFISDQDARRPGGLHPQAHLWDNGSDAVTELKEVMKVRNVALSNFSEKNIRSGMPMAMLEDVLIPVYFAHRYQVEAVSKMVGGMYYTYALRGDGQTVTKALSKGEQLKALNVLIDCLDPKFLQLPERIAQLIPPRPAGYDFSRELFKKRTGLAFDVLTPAETAADLPLSFIFNSERLNRMMQYEAANNGLGVYEMVNTLITKTWKSPRLAGIEKLIQSQTEQILLTYLLAASVNDNNSYLVKSVLLKGLAEFKTFIEAQQKATSDELTKGHFMLALERMKEPAAAKPTIHKEAPPGSPIGCDWD